MYRIFRYILFRMDAEQAHHFTMRILSWLSKCRLVLGLLHIFYVKKRQNPIRLWGIDFPHRVGLAAGLDKNADAVDALGALGFAFIEIGTVTPLPQPGNEKPRLFRLPKDEALINRMGFNNDGAVVIAERLKQRKTKVIIGGNIGKNKITTNDDAVNDYLQCMDTLYDVVDYLVVNVSSPNTPGLRALQDKAPLMEILRALQERRTHKKISKPILLKIAPDLTDGQLEDIVEITNMLSLDGLVANNTTISREGLSTPPAEVEAIGTGGLSGKPIVRRSTAVVRYLCKRTKVPVIAVGGIMTAEDAREKLDAGASLVQLYTGFIYQGPKLIRDINSIL
jgi:dihydroorotate dehydrogenase